MNDLPDDKTLHETLTDAYKASERAGDAPGYSQERKIIHSFYFKLYSEKRTLEKHKQAEKEKDNWDHPRLLQIQSLLDFVSELLNMDGLKELGEQLAEKAAKSVGKRRPGDLSVTVDDVNQTVTVYQGASKQNANKFSRSDVVGQGIVTWDLLVAFAKCGGSLERNTAADVKKLNTSVNRKNLGKKLMDAMNLAESPIVEGKNGVMCFRSIQLPGSTSSPDALDRKTITFDDQATEYLKSRGVNMPVTD